jgi:hypothetical protein
MLRCASAYSRSGRSPPLDTAFHSPAPTPDLSTGLRGRVNAPGLHLQSDPENFPGPFGFALPPRRGFFLPRRARSSHAARCQVPSQNSPSVLKPPLPSGTSQSLGIDALNLIPNRKACPCELPDLPSLPAALKNNFSFPCASDHRSGSATSRQAPCPSNLLEPHSSCTQTILTSIKKRACYASFIKIYLSYNQYDREMSPWIRCG